MKRVSKETAEDAILKRFLEGYSKRFGVELINIHHRDRPDYEVTNPKTGEIFGIEITVVYQDDEEAKIQYGAVKEWGRFVGSSKQLLSKLNMRLEDKALKSKSYNYSGRMILAIWWGSLVFSEKFDIDFIRHEIRVPENDFLEIWLIIRNKDDYSPELYLLQ